MKTPQFFYEEFTRLLERAASGDDFLHCNPQTKAVIQQILSTDYPEQEDDEMRKRNYTGQKRRFPATKLLDQFCSEPLYISTH